MREEGYYWVKYDSEWLIIEYWFGAWSMLTGEGDETRKMIDSDFEEIDENRIVRDSAVSKFIGDIAKVTGDSPEQVIKTLREHYNG